MIIGLISCETIDLEENNKDYLDFLKDKIIMDIQIVDNTKYH
jgi:hypothetical protein